MNTPKILSLMDKMIEANSYRGLEGARFIIPRAVKDEIFPNQSTYKDIVLDVDDWGSPTTILFFNPERIRFMTEPEKLNKIIQKAISNGFEFGTTTGFSNKNEDGEITHDFLNNDDLFNEIGAKSYYRIIFRHDFAKAFWGKHPIMCASCDRHHSFPSDCDAGGGEDLEHWVWQLQEAVRQEDPLQYYFDHLGE